MAGEVESEDEEDEAEQSDDPEDQPAASAFRANAEDDDFLVEDDTFGAPSVELPFQFSQYSTMKTKDLFKFAVEWMTQKKINPAFAMDDEVYQIAFRRLDDFVKGLGGSKYQSAAWVAGFLKSLKSRPILASHRFMNDGLNGHCDACNRTGHPATYEVEFTGNTYDKDTLEEFSEDDSDSDDVRESDIPAAGTRYYLGRTCMQNAKVAHALAHWRFHLNEWVVDYLEAEGFCIPEKIVERDRWSTRKRREYANTIVDRMETAGEIKRLHRDFKTEIEDAQNKQVSLNYENDEGCVLTPKQQGRYDRSSS